jgi:hypothetical protein
MIGAFSPKFSQPEFGPDATRFDFSVRLIRASTPSHRQRAGLGNGVWLEADAFRILA